MDPISTLSQVIQSLAGILILGGMVVAFFWKVAFYINLILCLIITFAITYLVYTLNGNIVLTIIIFVAGLFASWAIAAIGGLLTILEGLALSAFGFWGYFVGSSPSSFFSFGTVIGSIVASIISTFIAVFIGGRLISSKSFSTRPSRNKSQTIRTQNNIRKTELLSEQKSIQIATIPEGPPVPVKTSPPKRVRITDEEKIFETKAKLNKQLETLETNIRTGKISETTGMKLKDELNSELKEIDKNFYHDLKEEIKYLEIESNFIKSQVADLDETMNALETQYKSKSKEEEEINARWRIKRLEKNEFKSKKQLLSKEIEEIEKTFDEKSRRKEQLEKNLISVNQFLEDEQELFKKISSSEYS